MTHRKCSALIVQCVLVCTKGIGPSTVILLCEIPPPSPCFVLYTLSRIEHRGLYTIVYIYFFYERFTFYHWCCCVEVGKNRLKKLRKFKNSSSSSKSILFNSDRSIHTCKSEIQNRCKSYMKSIKDQGGLVKIVPIYEIQ